MHRQNCYQHCSVAVGQLCVRYEIEAASVVDIEELTLLQLWLEQSK